MVIGQSFLMHKMCQQTVKSTLLPAAENSKERLEAHFKPKGRAPWKTKIAHKVASAAVCRSSRDLSP
jgi:hypothetical protein